MPAESREVTPRTRYFVLRARRFLVLLVPLAASGSVAACGAQGRDPGATQATKSLALEDDGDLGVPSEFAVTTGGSLPRQGALATVDWTAPADHDEADWIGLYRTDADPSDIASYLSLAVVGHPGESNGQLSLPLPKEEAGPFELRYVLGSALTPVATGVLEVRPTMGDEFSLASADMLPAQGSSATIDWAAPADHGDGDWIGLYRAGADDVSFLAYEVVGHPGETSGQVTLQLPEADPGPFEGRYFLASTYTAIAETLISPQVLESSVSPDAHDGVAPPESPETPTPSTAPESAIAFKYSASTTATVARISSLAYGVSTTLENPYYRPRDPAFPRLSTIDLLPTGVMRYYSKGSAIAGLQVNVMNVGTTASLGASGRVSVDGQVFSGVLAQYYGQHAVPPEVLRAGELGYIAIEVPQGLMLPCHRYSVSIDLDRTMQQGAGVYANDTQFVTTTCPQTWHASISERTMGHPIDDSLRNKSLQNIVSSFFSGRADGKLCSSCHHYQSSYPYHPDVLPNSPSPAAILSTDRINLVGPSWSGGVESWGYRFSHLPVSVFPHTEFLREAVRKWIDDGSLP